MDAKQFALAAVIALALAAAGCLPPNGAITVHPTTAPGDTPTLQPEPNTEVTAQPAESVDDEMAPIQKWIERIDEAAARANPDPYTTNFPAINYDDYEERESPTGYGEPTVRESEANAAGTAEEHVEQPANEEAPVLGEVTVRAATPSPRFDQPMTQATSDEDAGSTGVNEPAKAANAPVTFDQVVERWLDQPRSGTFRDQLDHNIVMVLAGKYEEARRPLEMVSDEQREMGQRFIETLISIRESHGGDPEAEANRVLSSIDALSSALVTMGEPVISNIALTRSVSGFGRYEEFDPPRFSSGRANEFVVYCELKNFVSRPAEDGGYESKFAMTTTIFNRAGDAVLELENDNIMDTCRSRRHDCFIPRLVRLPATLSPGEYVVKVTIVDKIGEKVAESKTEFRIVARS